MVKIWYFCCVLSDDVLLQIRSKSSEIVGVLEANILRISDEENDINEKCIKNCTNHVQEWEINKADDDFNTSQYRQVLQARFKGPPYAEKLSIPALFLRYSFRITIYLRQSKRSTAYKSNKP